LFAAQKKYISGHFDTTIGMKVEAQSYHRILETLGKQNTQVLFLTDLIKGLLKVLLYRVLCRVWWHLKVIFCFANLFRGSSGDGGWYWRLSVEKIR
jgi:hypothetical protein